MHTAANLLFCAHLGLSRPNYDHRYHDFKVVYKQTHIPGASFHQFQFKNSIYLLVGLVRSELVQKNTQKIEKFFKILDAAFFHEENSKLTRTTFFRGPCVLIDEKKKQICHDKIENRFLKENIS